MGKTLKDILKIAGICIVSGVVGGNLLQFKTIAEPPISNHEIHSIRDNPIKRHNFSHQKTEIYSPNLLLNRDDQIYFVTNKNEEQGIKDIRKIINNSKYEEAWIYLPERQKWYETGIEAKHSLKWSYVTEDMVLKKIILGKEKKIKEIVFYHYHPSFYDSKSCNYCSSYPSTPDLNALIINTKTFNNYNVKGKVCSKAGIVKYSLTEKAIKEFQTKDSINLDDYAVEKIENRRILNGNYFNIKFTPFEIKTNQ